jgi:hypothetical protein
MVWKTSCQELINKFKYYGENRILWVKYEDLVLSPKPYIKQICEFLNVDFQENMLEINLSNSSFDQGSKNGIYTSSINKWRGSLTKEEVWIVQQLNRKQMNYYAYSLEKLTPSILNLFWLLISFPKIAVVNFRIRAKSHASMFRAIYDRITLLINRS